MPLEGRVKKNGKGRGFILLKGFRSKTSVVTTTQNEVWGTAVKKLYKFNVEICRNLYILGNWSTLGVPVHHHICKKTSGEFKAPAFCLWFATDYGHGNAHLSTPRKIKTNWLLIKAEVTNCNATVEKTYFPAWIPSQVDDNLIRTRFLSIPDCW